MLLILALQACMATAVLLQGLITSVNDIPISMLKPQTYCVVFFQPNVYSGQVQDMDVQDIYAMRGVVGNISTTTTGTFSYTIPDTTVSYVSVLAFEGGKDCVLDLSTLPAIGYYRDVQKTFWMQNVKYADIGGTIFNIDLHSVTAFKPSAQSCCNGAGLLTTVHGQAVLRVKGTRQARGYAHGCLLSKYIMDHFRFFTLETQTLSATHYLSVVVPFVEKVYKITPAYDEELSSVLEGMKNCSTASDLFIPELGRNIQLVDLYYLNAYGSYTEWDGPRTTKKKEGHCTQFAFWGKETADGETIVGRNMDGENDFRKITVENVLIFSVTPDAQEEPKANSYAHVFWPGFIGTASGLSSAGIHVMDNDGSSNPNGPFAVNGTSDGWVQREILARAKLLSDVAPIINEYKSSQGGMCIDGCNIVMGASSRSNPQPALVYEGDRAGGVLRHADQVPPYGPNHLMVSNHFSIYGFDPLQPLQNFGEEIYFSSLWRYAAGQHRIEEWNHYTHTVTFDDVVTLLQIVNHGSTEHSVITEPIKKSFSFAKADMRTGGWYAPFLTWTNFTLDELLQL